MPAPVRYEVRVLGQLGPAARGAFADLGVRVGPTSTVLSGALDQAALHRLLERIQKLGMEVVDVGRLDVNVVVVLVVGVSLLAGMIAWQVRAIERSTYPGIRAVQSLASINAFPASVRIPVIRPQPRRS